MITQKILHIVHPEIDFNKIEPDSLLLQNEDEVSQCQHHSSLGDASASYIQTIATKFDKIIFHPNNFDTNSDLFHSTMVLLRSLSHRHIIEGIDLEPAISFVGKEPALSGQCLWTFGCSHTHGTGLEIGQRYSDHLAGWLGRSLKVVAQPGSSIFWSLSKIFDADFRTDDVVIWQITTPGRLTCYLDGNLNHTRLSERKDLLDYYVDDQIFFEHMSHLDHGVKYLRQLGVKFAVTSILPKNQWFYRYLDQYARYPEYCYTPDVWVDLGNDKIHAGPLSNKLLASRLLDHLQYTNV